MILSTFSPTIPIDRGDGRVVNAPAMKQEFNCPACGAPCVIRRGGDTTTTGQCICTATYQVDWKAGTISQQESGDRYGPGGLEGGRL